MGRLTVLTLASVAALSISAAASGVVSQDSAVGTIERLSQAGFATTTHVNATSGPQGEDARGTFWQIIERPGLGPVESRGHVTCMTLDGNVAAVRGTVDESTDPFFVVGSEVQIEIEDNGSPGRADRTIVYSGFSESEDCPIFGIVWAHVVGGNFTVHDR